MRYNELDEIREYMSICLKRLGYSIAASNVLTVVSRKLLNKYALQIITNNINSWPPSQKEITKSKLQKWNLL